MDERIWLKHPETGGYFHCPAEAAEVWQLRGWEPTDPPEEPNPAVAEWVSLPAPEEPAPEPETTEAAPSGETQEG